jgi:uncharacterized integral membrane protein
VQRVLRVLRWSVFLVLVVVASIAMIENRTPVSLTFLGWSTAELPVYWWLVVAFVLGGMCGWSMSGVGAIRAKAGARRAQTALERSRAEVETLRGPSSDHAGH